MHAPRPAALPPIEALGVDLPSPAATEALGRRLAAALPPTATVLLSGPLGAGKSHLARAVVRARLGDPDALVASPSYTLVNVYESPAGEIWHADLYRLSGPGETAELGLDDAAGRALLLVEWPDRWQPPPARRLEIALEVTGDEARRAVLLPRGPGWTGVIAAARP